MSGPRNAALWMMGLALVGVVCSCSRGRTEAAGLEVMITAADALNPSFFDSVEIVVKQEVSAEKWHQLLDVTPRVPAEIKLPMWVSIQAGESPNQEALILVTALKNSIPVLTRAAQVQLPRNRVAQMVVILSERCVGKLTDECANGSCEPATGVCGGPIVVDPNSLPTYRGAGQSVDAGTASLAADAATPTCGAGDCTEMPSCRVSGPGTSDCGAEHDSCCTSLMVTGGTYFRTFEATDGGVTGEADPATVSSFRLDKYHVTVGRFRQFVAAWKAGYRPPTGSGKHTHLNGGKGLADSARSGTWETGWDAADNGSVAPTDSNLLRCGRDDGYPYTTWTSSAAAQEALPMNCVNWFEAYAFCVWDGGFLGSEAEWGYAAAGGDEQRLYPWGNMAPGTANEYAIYDCNYPNASGTCTGVENIASVGTATKGAGRWGQLDLMGSAWQWNLDWHASYKNPCIDCAFLTGGSSRMDRGADYEEPLMGLQTSSRSPRSEDDPSYRGDNGVRCARAP